MVQPVPPPDSAALRQPHRYGKLIVANVGDSRAVLSRGGVAFSLSKDQTATREDEQARIEAAGGWVNKGRLNGVLAVSRAFGDVEHKTLKEKCWERSFAADPLICEPVRDRTSCLRVQMHACTAWAQ